MRITVTKVVVVLSAGIIMMVAYRIDGVEHQKHELTPRHPESRASKVLSSQPTVQRQAVEVQEESKNVPLAINADEIKASLQRLGADQLQERKANIQKQMADEKLTERFNRHELKSDEVLKLRRLALESSLITIRLYELN